MPPASSAVKAAVVAQLKALFPDPQALVVYGAPGTNMPDVIIGVGNVRDSYERPVSAATRPREQTSELDIIFSVYFPGDETVQQPATEGAYQLLGVFADWFKTRPNETVNSTCREAWVIRDELVESVAYQPAESPQDDPIPVGRVAEITAVLQFKARV